MFAFAACSRDNASSIKDGKKEKSEMNNNELQKNFTMKFSSVPKLIIAKQEASLSFIPKNIKDSTANIPLDVVHEKKIHLIVVSNDLSWFRQIHPESKSDGSYNVTTKFPHGGDFVMFADYTPTGFSNQVTRIPVNVSGNQLEAKKYSVQKLIWQGDDGYKAEINTDGKLISGKETLLKVLITKNEKPVTDLDVYLGALGHFAIISEDTKNYLYAHAMDLRIKGTEIIFHTEFETAGIYRGFLQFNHAEKIHTADFVLILQ
ncbi:MAG: FixH family protein [Chitinophagales bacterium]|nr:FixH family protein [Chitinophagales bacterium]